MRFYSLPLLSPRREGEKSVVVVFKVADAGFKDVEIAFHQVTLRDEHCRLLAADLPGHILECAGEKAVEIVKTAR